MPAANEARDGGNLPAAELPRTRPDDEGLSLEVEGRVPTESVPEVQEVGFHAIDRQRIALEIEPLVDEGELEVLRVGDPHERRESAIQPVRRLPADDEPAEAGLLRELDLASDHLRVAAGVPAERWIRRLRPIPRRVLVPDVVVGEGRNRLPCAGRHRLCQRERTDERRHRDPPGDLHLGTVPVLSRRPWFAVEVRTFFKSSRRASTSATRSGRRRASWSRLAPPFVAAPASWSPAASSPGVAGTDVRRVRRWVAAGVAAFFAVLGFGFGFVGAWLFRRAAVVVFPFAAVVLFSFAAARFRTGCAVVFAFAAGARACFVRAALFRVAGLALSSPVAAARFRPAGAALARGGAASPSTAGADFSSTTAAVSPSAAGASSSTAGAARFRLAGAALFRGGADFCFFLISGAAASSTPGAGFSSITGAAASSTAGAGFSSITGAAASSTAGAGFSSTYRCSGSLHRRCRLLLDRRGRAQLDHRRAPRRRWGSGAFRRRGRTRHVTASRGFGVRDRPWLLRLPRRRRFDLLRRRGLLSHVDVDQVDALARQGRLLRDLATSRRTQGQR